VVSERRPNRGGIASWAVAVSAVSVSAAVIVVTLHDSGAKHSDPATSQTVHGEPRPAETRASDPAQRPAPQPEKLAEAAPTAVVATTAAEEAAVPSARAVATSTSTPTSSTAALATAAPVASVAPVAAVATVAPPATTTTRTTPPPTAAAPAPAPAPPPTPAPTAPKEPAAPPPAPAALGGAFDRASAKVVLSAAAAQAAGCKQPDDPAGGARVTVTFSPSGRVMSAQVVGPPFQGTKTGACIATAFRGLTVPAFDGDPIAVTKEVNLH
jgi:hypothetical protein